MKLHDLSVKLGLQPVALLATLQEAGLLPESMRMLDTEVQEEWAPKVISQIKDKGLWFEFANCYHYIIVDTNWLMDAKGEIHKNIEPYPIAINGLGDYSSKFGRVGYGALPFHILIPSEVKSEIGRLHERGHDTPRTANAKRNYISLLGLPAAPKALFCCHDWIGVPPAHVNILSRRRFNLLASASETSLSIFNNVELKEPAVGPDSLVDKGIISLARHICEARPLNHCFVATHDTGIQTEIANLFYKDGLKIGSPLIEVDWRRRITSTATDILNEMFANGCVLEGDGEIE